MKSRDFFKILFESGMYRTDVNQPRSLADRIWGRFDVWYYLRVFGVVVRAARVARHEGAYTDEEWADDACRMLGAAEACGGRALIDGYHHVTAGRGPRVYVANHMSTLDTYVLPLLALGVGHAVVVVKESLLRYPLFGVVMRAVGPISVGRKNPREDLKHVLERGRECLEHGDSVVLFPQATRSVCFTPDSLNSLGAKLAARAGVPVMAVALKTDFQGTGRVFRDFGPIDRGKPIRIRFGAPIQANGDSRAMHEATVRFIGDTLREFGGEPDDK